MFVHMYMPVCVCIYVSTYMCVCVCVRVCVRACVRACGVCVHIRVSVHVCMCVHVRACMYVRACVCLVLTLLAAIRGLLRVFLCWVLTLAPDARAPHQGDVVVGGAVTPPHLTGQGDGSLLRERLKVSLVLLVTAKIN